MPVQVVGLVHPEGLGVRKRLTEDFILRMALVTAHDGLNLRQGCLFLESVKERTELSKFAYDNSVRTSRARTRDGLC